MKTSFALKREARQLLRPVYWSAFLVCLISFVLYGYAPNAGGIPITLYNVLERFILPSSFLLHFLQLFVILFLLHAFIINPLTVGRAHYFLRGIDGTWKLRHLFSPFFSRNYFRIVLVMGARMFLISIAPIIGFIILVFVPLQGRIIVGGSLFALGIFIYYHHRLTPYLLAENPKLKFQVTQGINAQISSECKFHGLFVIDFSFITWYIVGALFFGVGQFFFLPYHEAAMAVRYRELLDLASNQAEFNEECSNEPPPDQKSNDYAKRYSFLLYLALALSLILGLFPATTANAHTEMEFVVTTEQELRDAVEQNRSPIRIDTTIIITEGTIFIEEGQDIVLRGTGVLIMAHDGWRETTRHFSIFGGQLTLQGELSLTRDIHIEYGGGIFVSSSGYFIMEGGRVEYNRSGRGGGVEVRSGSFQMYGGVIRENHANGSGGGVYLDNPWGGARFYMIDGEISGNTANSSGGGISVMMNSHFAMHGGRITGNRAERDGGGIDLWVLSTFSMTGGEISYNHADRFGGAIGIFAQQFGYEHISIGPAAHFHGNTAAGQVSDWRDPTGEMRPHRSFGLHAGLAAYPQIHWDGDNSRPGTHLINNYDIGFMGMRRPAEWQIHLVLAGFILLGKGFALASSLRQEKKAKSQEEDALCDINK